ncbi:MAG: hypothetical protein K2K17_12520, partial [Lachnospiraceae bacterium]|nr:hypothetical protein [Lachnospiraceae bacterium]
MRKIERMFILSATCMFFSFVAAGCNNQSSGNMTDPFSGDTIIITPSDNIVSDATDPTGIA